MTDADRLPDQPLGELLRDDDRVGLRYERRFTHRPERVWHALTDPDEIRHWLPCDVIGPREEGATLRTPFRADVVERFGIEDSQVELSGRIVTWDPYRRFAWIWDTELLTFDLEPLGDEGTLLTTTVWLGPGPGPGPAGAGYHICLGQLLTLVETGTAPPFVDVDPTPFEGPYAAIAEAAGVPAHT